MSNRTHSVTLLWRKPFHGSWHTCTCGILVCVCSILHEDWQAVTNKTSKRSNHKFKGKVTSSSYVVKLQFGHNSIWAPEREAGHNAPVITPREQAGQRTSPTRFWAQLEAEAPARMWKLCLTTFMWTALKSRVSVLGRHLHWGAQ